MRSDFIIFSSPSLSYIGTSLLIQVLTATGISLSVFQRAAENEFLGNSGTKIVRVGNFSLIDNNLSISIYFPIYCSNVILSSSISSFTN